MLKEDRVTLLELTKRVEINKQGYGLVAKRGFDMDKGDDISEVEPLLKVWLGLEVGGWGKSRKKVLKCEMKGDPIV